MLSSLEPLLPFDVPADAAKDAEEFLAKLKQTASEYEQGAHVDSLAVYVAARFSEAKAHKMSLGVDEQIAKAQRVVRKQYSPEELALMASDEPKIFSGITDTKIRGGRSWLLDILTNARDKPYTVQASPIPSLPPAAEDAIVEQLATELERQASRASDASPGAMAAGAPLIGGAEDFSFPMDFRERAATLKSLALTRASALANEAATRIERRIHDRLSEAGWRQAFEAFATDIFMYPAAILKGPYSVVTKKLRWQDGELRAAAERGVRISRVAPDRFYPAPNAADVNSCPYVIEVVPSSAMDLQDAKAIEGVDAAAIDKVLASFELGTAASGFDGPNLVEPLASAQSPATASYELLVYSGRLPAEQLAQMGIQAGIGEQPEVEVWVCNNIVLRAVRNPNLLGRRPYYVASFAPTPGSIWGRALPEILDDVQRVCNACLRGLGRNMSFSAAPIGEYDSNRLEGETDIAWITPGRMYKTTSDPMFGTGSRSPALRFQVIPSAAPQMLSVHAAFLKLADDVSGVPAYVLGAPQAAGAGRTLGGLSLLMGNAAKGLKAVVGHIDVNVIEPLVTDCYMALMTDSAVPAEDKVDVNIMARGSAGLLQQELAQNRALEALQMLTPYADRELVPKDGMQHVLRRVMAGLGFEPDQVIPDPAVPAQLRAALAGDSFRGAEAPSAAQEGTPTPQLDGRSAQPADPAAQVRVPVGAP